MEVFRPGPDAPGLKSQLRKGIIAFFSDHIERPPTPNMIADPSQDEKRGIGLQFTLPAEE